MPAVTDGLLDVCIAEPPSFLRILQLIPRVLRGAHEGEPEVTTSRQAALHLSASEGLPLHADGEILSLQADIIDVILVPQGLPVLMPAQKHA